MKGRVTGLTVIILLLFGLVLGQSVVVQVHRADALNAAPDNPKNSQSDRIYARGDIVGAKGVILAHSVKRDSVSYPWRRMYPYGSLTSQLVGFDSWFYGTGGLEYQYYRYLVSHDQPPHSLEQVIAPVRATDTVYISLEVALQQVAKTALAGRAGAVVALDPRDGAVLAMYSNPTYDPKPLTALNLTPQQAAWARYNKRDADGFRAFRAVAFGETFPPGSTSKVVTTAGVNRYWPGLNEKYYPVQSCIQLPHGNPQKPLCNAGGSPCGGLINVMLPQSCDPGYAEVGMDLGGKAMADIANQFGYNQIPPLDLPGVTKSAFPPASFLSKPGNAPFLAYSAIGQGDVRTTALQNALVAAAIANHGKLMAPHLLRNISDQLGNSVLRWSPFIWQRPIGPQMAAAIVPLMQGVVQYGTASGIFNPADDVAAKTGTAQVHNETETDDWMIAFAPASAPRIAVAVVVPNQPKSAWGATVAGPIMKCVIEAQLAIDKGQPPTGTATTCPA